MYRPSKKISIVLVVLFFLPLGLDAQNPASIESGMGKGIRILAADSSLYTKIGVRTQNLVTTEAPSVSNADWKTTVLIRRFRLKFDGWAYNPKWVYKLELGLSNRDIGASGDFEQVKRGSKIILDAIIKMKAHKQVTIWFGQAKLPGNRERLISSQKLQLVDRSLLNSKFNIDRDIGIQIHSKFNLSRAVLKPIVSVATGEGRNLTVGNINGFHYVGKLECLPMGEFTAKGDYFGGDLAREESPKLALAAAFGHNAGATRQGEQLGKFLVDSTGALLSADLNTLFADMMFKYKGYSLMAEYVIKKASREIIDANNRSFNTGDGISVSMGYLLTSNVEFATRFTQINPDNDFAFTQTNEYTAGLSKYVKGHHLKVQGDISLIEQKGDPEPGIRIRLQMELAF